MCGIGGVIERGPERIGRAVTEAIVRSQLRRGPDAQAVLVIPGRCLSATLGHSRLSILDLSPSSNQPMWDAGGRRCLIHNGEIYNYCELRDELRSLGRTFHTGGDAEVILAALDQWGAEAVDRFMGMFAIAVWDSREEELWLCRDRFGVKPLYYAQSGTAFYFASTPGAIAAKLGLSPDLDYIRDGIDTFTYERDDGRSQFQGAQALPPGHTLRLGLSAQGGWRIKLDRYYDLETRVAALQESIRGEPPARLAQWVGTLLDASVVLRLRSDVPVGLSLSGGLDSSSIAAIVATKRRDVTAFSYGDPGDPFSEGERAAAVAGRTGIHVVFCAPDARKLNGTLWETLEAQGAPFAGGCVVAQNLVFKAARERGVTVLLGGQGGDEILMGYHKFKLFLLEESLRKGRPLRALGLAASIAGFLLAHPRTLSQYWQHRHRVRSGAKGSELLVPSATYERQALSQPRGMPAWKRQALDVTRISLPTLLRYEDRSSMGNSVETRLPYLDHRLVELGIALPEVVKVRRGLGKWPLREAMRGALPENVLNARRKVGFEVEIRRWMREGMGQVIRDRLEETRARYNVYLRRPIEIGERFSDERLGRDPFAFPEAMSLAWLGGGASGA